MSGCQSVISNHKCYPLLFGWAQYNLEHPSMCKREIDYQGQNNAIRE